MLHPDLEEAFSGFAWVADEMYRLTFGGCHGLYITRFLVDTGLQLRKVEKKCG